MYFGEFIKLNKNVFYYTLNCEWVIYALLLDFVISSVEKKISPMFPWLIFPFLISNYHPDRPSIGGPRITWCDLFLPGLWDIFAGGYALLGVNC